VQVPDGVSDRFAHPLDLVLSTLVQRELDPPRPDAPRTRGSGHAVVELDALTEESERLGRGRSLDFGLVDLGHPVPGMRETMSEIAVVRQQEGARRVRVETADRDDARAVRDEVDDGAPSLRVARRGDDTRRLVQEDVGEPLALHARAVDLHHVVPPHHGVQLAGSAVDADAARADELVRTSA